MTGGARRVGLAITRALVEAGYAVAVHANTSRAEADAVCAAIRSQGGHTQTVQAELSEHTQVLKLVPSAVAAVGPLTLLVNNASIFEADDIATLSRELFDRHMAIHVRAPLFPRAGFCRASA